MRAERERQGIFISYARQDGESLARALHERLSAEAPDMPAWLDRHDLEGGVGWWTQIEQHLDRAEFLILLMTPAALHSENTRREWRSARQRGVCVYPVTAAQTGEVDYSALPNWMRKAHFYDLNAEWEKLVAHLRRGCRATRVPFMAPALTASFVHRPRETEALIDLLCSRDASGPVAITTALRGAGGFGKTTLAAAICHDDRVLEAFDDGILWVTLGQSPHLLNELAKLYAALTGERPGFVDVDDAARELTEKLQSKTCLLVIDDVWHRSHVTPFLLGAPECVRLITTRSFDVAYDARRIDVDQMEPGEAVQLLVTRAGAAPDAIEPFRQLASRLGEWPLTITLAGSVMRQRIERGESVAKALDYVNRALDKRGVTAFDRGQPSSRQEAVVRTVGASLDLLTTDEQRRCAELSVFPEDAAIPLDVAATLWELDPIDAEDLARKIDDVALVDFDLRTGTLRIHDVLRTFFAERLHDVTGAHRRLIDKWGDPRAFPDHQSSLEAAYMWRRYAYHMRGAGLQAQLQALLLDPLWLDLKLRATGFQSLIADFEECPGDAALALVHDALRLSAPMLGGDSVQRDAQLVGRLLARDEPAISAFRQRVVDSIHRPWLRLMHPTLDSPGEMLLMTLVGHQAGVTALADDSRQDRVISASNDGTVCVWDRAVGSPIHKLHHFELGARAVAASGDGQVLVSGGADGLLYWWNLGTAEPDPWVFFDARGPAVTALALSSNATLAVWASREKVVRVWDVARGMVRNILTGHSDRVTSVAMSADGSRAVSGSDDCTVRVWNLASGELVRTLDGHTDSVNAVAIAADGRHALSGSTDRTVKMWDLDTGSCVRTLAAHAGSVTAVALAPAVERAISGSADKSAVLWNLRTGEALARLEGHSDAITAVLMDEAGTHATTASADRTIKLWRLDSLRAPVAKGAHAGEVVALVFSNDGQLCASGGDDGRVIVREVHSGRVVRAIPAHTAPVHSLGFSDDGSCLLSAGLDNQYWMWTIESGASTWIPVRHMSAVDTCALSGIARYLTTSCADRFVYVWDVPSGGLIDRFGTRRLFDHLIARPAARTDPLDQRADPDLYLPGEPVYNVAKVWLSADGDHVVLSATTRDPNPMRHSLITVDAGAPVALRDGVCLLTFSLRTSEIHSIVTKQREAISAFAIDGGATHVLWACSNHELELADLELEAPVARLRGHVDRVNAVALTADGRRGASCSRDRSVRVWDLQSADQIAAFTFDSALRSIALSPRDDILAVGDVAGRVHLLRLET